MKNLNLRSFYSVLATLIAFFVIMALFVFAPVKVYGAAKTSSNKTATVSKNSLQSVPSGVISAEEALKRIKNHQDTINERLTDMTQKYDKDVNNTLQNMFVRNRVHQTAMMYVSSWAGNGVYLEWVNGLRSYYKYHLEMLNESARPLKSGKSKFMKTSDLAYLDKGMELWQQKEKQAASLMNDYVYHLSKNAYFLGEAMKYTSDNRYFSIHTPEFRKQHEPEVNLNRGMAKKVDSVISDTVKRINEAGGWKLFSSVTSSERIAVENDIKDENSCHEVKIFTPRNVPMPPELCTGSP